MSTPTPPGSKPPETPGGSGPTKRGTVGVYDRPASADRAPLLPKIITAILVLLALVLGYLFWPR